MSQTALSTLNQLAQQQKAFAARIRQPEANPIPLGIPEQRMKVYEELFFNNVAGFLDSGFPVLKEIMGDERWLQIAKDFFARHKCKTPYFLEISQEFLSYLEHELEPIESDPAYYYELAHYEWLELYVDVAEEYKEGDNEGKVQIDANGDIERGQLVLAPVVEAFIYNYPVHQASAENIDLAEQQTALLVYRNRSLDTKFIETNIFTLQLLDSLKAGQYSTVKQLLTDLLNEHNLYSPAAYQAGLETLKGWQATGLVLGVAAA